MRHYEGVFVAKTSCHMVLHESHELFDRWWVDAGEHGYVVFRMGAPDLAASYSVDETPEENK